MTVLFWVGNTLQTAVSVSAGAADLGFVEGEVTDPQLRMNQVGSDGIDLYAAENCPLENRRLAMGNLLKACWLMRESGSGTRDYFKAALSQDFSVSIDELDSCLEVPSNVVVLEAVRASELVTPVSELARSARPEANFIAPRLHVPCPPLQQLNHRARAMERATSTFVAAL